MALKFYMSGALGGQKESPGCRSAQDQEDLIHMDDGLIVPVTRNRMPLGARLAPPSYNDSVLNHAEQRQFQQHFTNTMGFTPQYSYTNR